MDRCGLADRICAGSGWVGIRPGAVEASPGKCYPRIAFRSNLARKAIRFRARIQLRVLRGREPLWRGEAGVYQSSFSPN
jgi:hypothetical protein